MKDDHSTPLTIFAIIFFLVAGGLYLLGVRTDRVFDSSSSLEVTAPASAATVAGDLAGLAGVIAVCAFAILVYFFPSLNARSRHHREVKSIFILNLFLGGTGIGWIIALIWSYSSQVEPET